MPTWRIEVTHRLRDARSWQNYRLYSSFVRNPKRYLCSEYDKQYLKFAASFDLCCCRLPTYDGYVQTIRQAIGRTFHVQREQVYMHDGFGLISNRNAHAWLMIYAKLACFPTLFSSSYFCMEQLVLSRVYTKYYVYNTEIS